MACPGTAIGAATTTRVHSGSSHSATRCLYSCGKELHHAGETRGNDAIGVALSGYNSGPWLKRARRSVNEEIVVGLLSAHCWPLPQPHNPWPLPSCWMKAHCAWIDEESVVGNGEFENGASALDIVPDFDCGK